MSTLAVLRQNVGDRLGVRLTGTVTARSLKGLIGFVDAALAVPDDSLAGSWIAWQGAAGGGSLTGKSFQVAGNRGGEITLRTPLPAQPDPLDAYDLYRRFSANQMKTAINYALAQAYPLLYVKVEWDVPEADTTLEYPYPALLSPASLTATGAPGGYWYAIIARSTRLGGDAPILATAGGATGIANPGTLSWPGVSGADFYILARSNNGPTGPWNFALAPIPATAAPGDTQTFIDTGASSSSYTAVLATGAALTSLRQLRRRTNLGATPPTYVELPGGLWEDLGSAVRVRYRPATGQYLQFVGIAPPPPLSLETDNTPVDTETVVCGAAMTLYSMVAEGEGLSNNDYTRQQVADWSKRYEIAKRQAAMAGIPYETHPPYSRVVTAPRSLTGPINP